MIIDDPNYNLPTGRPSELSGDGGRILVGMPYNDRW